MEKLKEKPRVAAPAALLTRTELQHLLKLSARTITKLVASGSLPRPIRVGQSYRWRTGDINRFIEQQA